MTTKSSLSVIVAAYNSQGILPQLVKRLLATLPDCGSEIEIILVNDGSTDRSWEVICRLAQEHPGVRGINLMRN